MTAPDTGRLMVLEFPEPGPALRRAYGEIALALHGTQEQRKALGDPTLLPRPWEPASCHTQTLRRELWDWLDRFATWLNHEYVWDPSTAVPPCWPSHPHLVHELAVLADHRRRAGRVLSSDPLEEWHRCTLPAFIERMRGCLQDHCVDGHQPWPARSRHAAHASGASVNRRQRLTTADLKATQEAWGPTAAPRHHRVVQVDTSTGEVLG